MNCREKTFECFMREMMGSRLNTALVGLHPQRISMVRLKALLRWLHFSGGKTGRSFM